MAPNTAQINKDELEAPQWLNGDFFTTVLQHVAPANVAVILKNFKITPATLQGDHYASVMFRAALDYKENDVIKTKSLIIKTLPEVEGHKRDLLKETHIFETEIGMYTEVLPKFEQILRAISDNTVLKAPCLYYALSPHKVIVFEDIDKIGYIVLRERHLNLEEAKAAYLKLAKWHAISYKLNLENPQLFDKYRYGILTFDRMQRSDFFESSKKLFIELLHSIPSLTQYARYFEALPADFSAKSVASFKEFREQPQEHAIYVLCHGDFHNKNLMLKLQADTSELQDVMLLDFQLCYMGSIANDLIYSIYMLLDTELRSKHQEELLYYYFSNFQATLRSIGYDGVIPKMLDFQAEMLRNKHFEIFMLITFMPIWFGFRNGNDPNDMRSTECRKAMYRNPEYVAELHRILPKFLYQGYLEN